MFDGGDKTKVTMTIGDRAPIAMTRQARPDPFVEEVFARNEATKKAWVKAEISSHIWTARLPAISSPAPIGWSSRRSTNMAGRSPGGSRSR